MMTVHVTMMAICWVDRPLEGKFPVLHASNA